MLSGSELLDKYIVTFEGKDTMMKSDLHEIECAGSIIAVKKDLWDSWTGVRYVNGEEHHGPVYVMGTRKPYDGARLCTCDKCQSYSKFRPVMN